MDLLRGVTGLNTAAITITEQNRFLGYCTQAISGIYGNAFVD